MRRREFLKNTATGFAGAAALTSGMNLSASETKGSGDGKKARVAFIGTGSRGSAHLRTVGTFPDVEIVAVCDQVRDRAEAAAQLASAAGRPAPQVYAGDSSAWQKLLAERQLDLAIIATGWGMHAEIAEAALNRKVYVGCEVPVALSVEDCWKLVDASEKHQTPCMMLENWSFRQDNLAVLNMIRLGLLGEIVHAHCAYSHDCRDYFYYGSDGKERWQIEFFRKFNRNYYPTHALGPILSWMDINAGDRFTEIYSVATPARGVRTRMARRFGPDHPGATTEFKQGDVVTSILKTAAGKTVVLNLDTQLPRPYANRWMVQGTKGIYDEEKGSVYLEGVSPKKDQWEPWPPYQEKYDHRFWKQGLAGGGHGGTDALELRLLVDSVIAKTETPLDVYDSVVMSAVVELSGRSIEQNRPVDFPDFTRGKWETRKPRFAPDQGIETVRK